MTINEKDELALSKIAEATDTIDFLIWDIQAVAGALNELLADLEDGVKDLGAYGLSSCGLPGHKGIVDRAWVLARYCRDTVEKLTNNQRIVSECVAGLSIQKMQDSKETAKTE